MRESREWERREKLGGGVFRLDDGWMMDGGSLGMSIVLDMASRMAKRERPGLKHHKTPPRSSSYRALGTWGKGELGGVLKVEWRCCD